MKRDCTDDRDQVKMEADRQIIDAPRRLLQFAVRDALAASKPCSTTEFKFKPLPSVVSMTNGGVSLVILQGFNQLYQCQITWEQ
ncbi:hypothetical protein SAY87_019239 [Trapa incisa]|uniref:Uncharacterized protein n=1 Tax=Trapa incisa TaxID=236973 RepID=A0AAN7Q261_9MYRT|nr:hypothetical protein SAY87_019239 [Trapa incisa]